MSKDHPTIDRREFIIGMGAGALSLAGSAAFPGSRTRRAGAAHC